MLTWAEVANPEERKMRPITYYGLDTDEKPDDVANGSKLIIMNKSEIYFFDAENHEWCKWGT